MTKSKEKKREKISVATEIDRVEERRTRFQDNIERAEFRTRRETLSDRERQDLEDEMTVMRERVQKLDKELDNLRGENRKNMMLSVAVLALSAFLYYAFIYGEEDL
ncbi:Coiled-coil domain-containing protein 167 [Merluccius polli]|uniref:Coiled-coil domain-containing protein 167 n=1 Tax=Merluccius polli TaxID=89951 RepID=A0AA47MIS7_MERPO|nr:Coiled-coil domain-containing protein 167 [Merluccius polli]